MPGAQYNQDITVFGYVLKLMVVLDIFDRADVRKVDEDILKLCIKDVIRRSESEFLSAHELFVEFRKYPK